MRHKGLVKLVNLTRLLITVITSMVCINTVLITSAFADEMELTPTPDTVTASSLMPGNTQNVQTIIPAPPSIDAKAYVLMDAKTGTIIAQKNADQALPPASLTKLMDLYLVFAAIKQGTINLDDKVLISTKAWKTGGSRMFVKAGDEVPVNLLIQGITVQSGNDATVALAEHVAGSEQSFVDMMNQQAQQLGMTNTHYMDATGLPKTEHKTTAHDLALLTRAIIHDFPDQYHFFGEKWFTYAGIKQPNRNRLLWRFDGADGLKTGHTEAAGFCLISSAQRDDQRLITVVLGAPSDNARTSDSIQLLTYGFRFYHTIKYYAGLTAITNVRVWGGKQNKITLGLAQNLYLTLPVGSKAKINQQIQLERNELTAPIKQYDNYGSLLLTLDNKTIASVPLIALENNARAGLFSRSIDHIKKMFAHLFNKHDD